MLEKYTELWNKIKSLAECNYLEKINGKTGKYVKHYIKIELSSDDIRPLNKILKLHNLKVIVRSVFEEDVKYYPQVFLDEWLNEL